MAKSDTDIQERPSRAFLKKFFARVRELAGTAGDALTTEIFDKAMKHARGHAGGVASAAKRKMPKATAELVKFERAFFKSAEPTDETRSGLTIGFYLSDDAAAQLAIPDGEAPDELHLTLAFLGDFRQYGAMAKAEILTCIRSMAGWSAPLAGEISGTGRYMTDDGIDVFYASVDMPGLNEFRADLVRRLANVGCPASNEHGFDPHITLAYIAGDAVTPNFPDLAGLELRFETISVVFGDEEVEIALSGMSAPGVAGLYHEVADLCADDVDAKMRLFMEQRFAEPPDWVNYLPKPGKYTHPEYGQMVFTRERNQGFVSNFASKVYQEKLPVDCEHDLAESGAVGWITLMRVNDDGSVDAKVDWNDRGRQLIEGDRFKYFSPAWFEKWTDPVTTTQIKDVAIGGAICVRPFFKEKSLRPLVSSERGLEVGDSAIKREAGDGFVQVFFTKLTPEPAPTNSHDEGVSDMATKFDPQNPPKTLSEAIAMLTEMQTDLTAKETSEQSATAELTTAKDAALALCDKEKPPATLSEAITQIGEKLASGQRTASEQERTAAEKITKLTERVASMEADNRRMRFTDVAKKFIGDRAGHVEMLEFLATDGGGEDGDRFKKYVTQQTALAEQARASNLFEEVGSAGTAASPTEQIEAKARELHEASKKTSTPLTYEGAMAQVVRENPKLYSEHQASQRSAGAAVR